MVVVEVVDPSVAAVMAIVEGTVVTDPDGADHFDEYNVEVEVTDGRLTIRPAGGASDAKICFVESAGWP